MLGAKHLCATPTGRELSAAIICEPEQNELCLEQRGVVWARVVVRGRMAHGAMPEAGINPIAGLAAIVRQAPILERRLRKLCARSRHVRPPTVTPTVMRAPVDGLPQSNVIPATAVATLDIRLTPGPDAAAIAAEIDRACRDAAAAAGVGIEWTPISGYRLATRVERARARGPGDGTGGAPGDRPAREVRWRSRLDGRDDPPDRAGHPDRHLRPRRPVRSAPGERVRRGRATAWRRPRSTSPRRSTSWRRRERGGPSPSPRCRGLSRRAGRAAARGRARPGRLHALGARAVPAAAGHRRALRRRALGRRHPGGDHAPPGGAGPPRADRGDRGRARRARLSRR